MQVKLAIMCKVGHFKVLCCVAFVSEVVEARLHAYNT